MGTEALDFALKIIVTTLCIGLVFALASLVAYWFWQSGRIKCQVCGDDKFEKIEGTEPACINCGWSQDPDDDFPGFYHFPGT